MGHAPSQRASRFTSCCRVTNDYIPPAPDNTHVLSPSSRGRESGRLNRVLCVRSHQAAVAARVSLPWPLQACREVLPPALKVLGRMWLLVAVGLRSQFSLQGLPSF